MTVFKLYYKHTYIYFLHYIAFLTALFNYLSHKKQNKRDLRRETTYKRYGYVRTTNLHIDYVSKKLKYINLGTYNTNNSDIKHFCSWNGKRWLHNPF